MSSVFPEASLRVYPDRSSPRKAEGSIPSALIAVATAVRSSAEGVLQHNTSICDVELVVTTFCFGAKPVQAVRAGLRRREGSGLARPSPAARRPRRPAGGNTQTDRATLRRCA